MDKQKFPVFTVVGEKNSGKTRLIEALIRHLRGKGFKVGVVKHIPHRDFTIDSKNKDSWRYTEAGAETVLCVSPQEIAVIRKLKNADEEFKNIFRFIVEDEFDCLFVEGFKNKLKDDENIPKIVVVKTGEEALKLLGQLKNVLCVVSISNQIGNIKVPSFSFNETEKILSIIEKDLEVYRILRNLPGLDCGFCGFKNCFEHAKAIHEKRSTPEKCLTLSGERKVILKVNGEKIPLNPFIQNIIKNTILAMISSLKGVKLTGKETLTIFVGKLKKLKF